MLLNAHRYVTPGSSEDQEVAVDSFTRGVLRFATSLVALPADPEFQITVGRREEEGGSKAPQVADGALPTASTCAKVPG